MTGPDVTAVPETVRRQIADLFLQVLDLRENLIETIEVYRRLDRSIDDAGPFVDDDPTLWDLTGLTAVMDLLGDMAERCTTGIGGTTGGIRDNYDSAEVIEFMWPSTAWPIPGRGEEDAATVDEMRAEVRRLDAVVTEHLKVCTNGPGDPGVTRHGVQRADQPRPLT